MQIFCGNANELGDISESPRKSFLFFLTVFFDLEIGLAGAKVE
jgi:hypothetical protein